VRRGLRVVCHFFFIASRQGACLGESASSAAPRSSRALFAIVRRGDPVVAVVVGIGC
jgi:hypothetical protein